MAFLQTHFFSETLGVSTCMNVLLPQAVSNQIGLAGSVEKKTYPVLYLLHGWSDDESIWMRRTSIERYAASLGLIVVMPRVELSYSQNMKSGLPFWNFVSEELPRLCQTWFPVSPAREDTFAAGLSMGGYGALRLGLACPERFAAVASLSGAVDINFPARDPARHAQSLAIFGSLEDLSGSPSDLFQIASTLPPEKCPLIYQCCGTEDFLYEDNVRFRDHARSLGLPLTYEEGPGAHEWGYWDQMIQKALVWLPLKDRPFPAS
jgi:S-formylglutathione hydrolase FrmB